MNKNLSKLSKGVTLVELLIAVVISAILIAAIYMFFIRQQRTYTTQEQVADMQQNVRVAINQMIREIRMAGFGGKNNNTNGNNDIISTFATINGFSNIINFIGGATDQITVLAAYERLGQLSANANAGATTIAVTYANPSDPFKKFNTGTGKYLCINGRDNYLVTQASPLKISPGLRQPYNAATPVFLVKAITYRLAAVDGTPVLFKNENLGGGDQPVAENIEDLQFRYRLADGTEADAPADPKQIRGVLVTLTARTRDPDPQLKGDGFRRRTLTTYLDLRNLRDDPS